MSISVIIEKINEVESALRTMRDSESITKGAFAALTQAMGKIKTEYAQRHGQEVVRQHNLLSRDKQLPLLSQAAGILLTVRTALPVAGNADTTAAETAIASAIQCIAGEVQQVMTTDTQQ